MNSPLFGPFAPAQKNSSLLAGLGASPAAFSLRVLVVEDNPVNREVACRMLIKRGHLVMTANDGAAGVSEWQKGGYDVILMDIQMPNMDGPTATRRIRAEEKAHGGHIPIIALTAHAMKEAEEDCLSNGMDGYISKPLQRDNFLNVVESLAGAGVKNIAAAKSRKMVDSAPAVNSGMQAAVVAPESNMGDSVGDDEPLIRLENMADYVGQDLDLQQKVLDLCVEALTAKMPLLRRAMSKDDRNSIKRIVHYLRGSLGLLGLPTLVKMGEDIECHGETLGVDDWRQRCEQFYALLRRLNQELRQLHAA
jgi:two-component system, sensor histidine kinase and response regulator